VPDKVANAAFVRSSSRPEAEAVWLLDASIYFFRGYFGMRDSLIDDQGEFCGGIHGFAGALAAVLERHGTTQGAVAFDESLGTCFRNDLFADYKANRAPPDDNIRYQFAQCARLCDLLGVSHYASSRYEADDLLASLRRKSRKEIIIYSKDKDLRQLVNVRCKVWDLHEDTGFDAASFAEHYHFAPELFPDYQALVGDSSDNVPGIPGFGPKTAGRMVARYGSLEKISLAREQWTADAVGVAPSGKLATRFAEHIDRAIELREVLRLASDAPLPARALTRRRVDVDGLARFLGAKRLRQVTARLRAMGILP